MEPEIRLDDEGDLDEVVASNASFHLERMSDDEWWFCVEADGKRVNYYFRSPDLHKAKPY